MENKIGKLILVRHGESEWNKLGKWTGKTEVDLTENGFLMAQKMGEAVKDIKIDRVFCSTQKRAQETLDEILKVLNLVDKIPEERSSAINERDYGDYTGKNKWEVKELIGEEAFADVRRGWDANIPNGENLKMVYDRAVPYFLNSILPYVLAGENILVTAHGNSIRALMKYIEKIGDKEVEELEMPFNTIILYDLDEKGNSLKKEIREIK